MPSTTSTRKLPLAGGVRNHPYLQRFRTRHGKLKVYFRRKGFARVPMPDVPIGSPDFERAYLLARAGGTLQPVIKDETRNIRDRTWNAAIVGYKATSPEWINARENTRKSIRYQLKFIGDDFGDALVEDITAGELEAVINAKAAHYPGAARMLLRGFRAALWYARKQKWRLDDPTAGIRKPRSRNPDGHHSWTDLEIEQYRHRHPLGSIARLAIEILVNTGLRRDDAITVGHGHVKDGVVEIEPQKTRGRGQWAMFPIEPELAAALAATTTGLGQWLVAGTTGRKFTNDQFGKQFRQWCAEAELPAECTAHGLRKACFRRLAERGCTPHEIAAWSGHSTNDLREVARYTKGRDQRLLALRASAKLRTA